MVRQVNIGISVCGGEGCNGYRENYDINIRSIIIIIRSKALMLGITEGLNKKVRPHRI